MILFIEKPLTSNKKLEKIIKFYCNYKKDNVKYKSKNKKKRGKEMQKITRPETLGTLHTHTHTHTHRVF